MDLYRDSEPAVKLPEAGSQAGYGPPIVLTPVRPHGVANGIPKEPKAGTNGTASVNSDNATANADGDHGKNAADAALIEAIVKALPKRLREHITQPANGNRSRNLLSAIKSLIVRELDDDAIKRIVEYYPDGIGAEYVGGPDHLEREIARIRAKLSRRRAAEVDAAAGDTGRPVIRVRGGSLPAVVDQAEAALIDRDPEVYEFGDEVVRPAMSPIRIAKDRESAGLRLVTIRINELIERMTKAANFQRFDKRSEELISIDCPKQVAATYLERIGKRRLRQMTAVTTSRFRH